MSPLSAQIISIITASILLLGIGWPIVMRRMGIKPHAPMGISPTGFDRRDVLIGFFFLLFYGITPLTAFLSKDAANAETTLTVGQIIGKIMVQAFATAAVFMRLLSRDLKPHAGWNRFISLKQVGLILIAVISPFICLNLMNLTGIVEWIAQKTDSSIFQDSVEQLRTGSLSVKLALAISAVICAPFIEELVFRGYLYPLLKKFTGPVFSCIMTSLLFGIVHMNLIMLIPLSLMGVLLVLVYERTKSIWAPITVHIIFNLITVVNILFIEPKFLS